MKPYISHLGFAALLACSAPADPNQATGELTAVHARAVVARIESGLVVGPDVPADAADFRTRADAIVSAQLRYAVGYLNGRKGSQSLQRTVIKNVVRVAGAGAGAGLAQYRYVAELQVMLGHAPENDAATELELRLPAQVDPAFLSGFLERYKTDCVSNLRDKPTVDTFFYYYRPEAFFCPLLSAAKPVDASSIQKVKATLQALPEGPTTFPEYDAIWKDGKLVYTGVFMQVDGAFGDIGRESYGSTIRELTTSFGAPTVVFPKDLTAKELGKQVHFNDVRPAELFLTFASAKGPIEAHLYLLASMEKPEQSVPDFASKYAANTEQADLVVFSGHASYGSDVERFSKLGSFKKGQYQVFLLNACDSFAYEAPALREAHLAVNQSAANPAGFFDLVVNAMPAPAHEIPGVTMSLVRALAAGTQSYKDILATINEEQRAVVLYDEDNLWGRIPAQ
jgi:hypothetical protein